MRTLERNQRAFWYAPYQSNAPLRNPVTGYLTGEYGVVYGNPAKARGNISAARGESSTRQFGNTEDYDRTIVLSDTAIDEYAVLWIDSVPELTELGALAVNQDGEVITPHDYIVKKVARSLNNVTLAVKKVDVG